MRNKDQHKIINMSCISLPQFPHFSRAFFGLLRRVIWNHPGSCCCSTCLLLWNTEPSLTSAPSQILASPPSSPFLSKISSNARSLPPENPFWNCFVTLVSFPAWGTSTLSFTDHYREPWSKWIPLFSNLFNIPVVKEEKKSRAFLLLFIHLQKYP